MQNVVGRPLLPWQRNWGKFGSLLHKIAYKSACMAKILQMLGLPAYPCCLGNDIWARHGDLVAYRLVRVSPGKVINHVQVYVCTSVARYHGTTAAARYQFSTEPVPSPLQYFLVPQYHKYRGSSPRYLSIVDTQ